MSIATGAAQPHRCSQPGCPGMIVDGYCDVCGSPPGPVAYAGGPPGTKAGTSAGASSADGSSASPASLTTMSRSSIRLASAALGSARAGVAGSRVTRRVGTSSTRLRGARLGAGITTVPPVAPVDAAAAVMTDPTVREDKRVCANCGTAVGRSRDGRPGRPEGFCPQCGKPYSFTAKLKAGDVVGGQYEVAGALAHGGLGWVYLGRDRNVSDRWVVLKGLLNSGDPDALAAAIAERQFLAQVEHPLIVEIYNFVTHEGAGYIVMEYVGGTSLKQLLKSRMQANHGRYDPIPLDQAIAYIVEILPAISYLHDLGLAYCDFKPDNVIQVGDAVKLIDLGGVRRIDDLDSPIYGTVGYQAPEVATAGTSAASDIYTIGRTLIVLAMEFRGYQSRYVASLPSVDDAALFQRYDSFYRLVAKACAADPGDRFGSADELRVQLLGVLREVVAADRPDGGVAGQSASSLLFGVPTVSDETLEWRHLPLLRMDDSDPMASWLHTISLAGPQERLELLGMAPQVSPEVRLATAYAALESCRPDTLALVDRCVADLLADDPWEWRAVWVSGLAALARGDTAAAQSAFNAVYGQVPGELAPKLALALACEGSGEVDLAESLYLICTRCDAAYIAPAAFGLARIRAGRADVDGAVAALDLIPATSRSYTQARRRRAGLLASSGRGLASLAAAMSSVDAVTLEPADRAQLNAEVLDTALEAVLRDGPQPSVSIGGRPAQEAPLREGLETAYRELATFATTREEQVHLVDKANEVRPWSRR